MEKDKKRVLKDYPNAIMGRKDDGSFVVLDEFHYPIAEEFYLPPALTEEEAWSHASLACKTTQHFNRTHPMRMDLKGIEAKMLRIEKRKRKSSYVR
jgi:hypothetical protein|tara:strand:+ start:113 stop:400 length:288 start_codon:yes stop_codon:yes gene_type:complete